VNEALSAPQQAPALCDEERLRTGFHTTFATSPTLV
jgi:hypothetical protein